MKNNENGGIMLNLERQQEILEIVNRKKSVTVEELSQELFVSGATIRRDLRVMEKQGLLKRSHGGAMPFLSSADEPAIAIREQENTDAKKSIANLAVKLIKNGDSIFLDSSTTTGFVVPLFNRFKYLTVTTTGIKNATLLSQTDNGKIYIAGGAVSNHSNSITGTDTMDYIARIRADVTLVSCSGADINAGFTDADIEQSKLKRKMKENSKKLVMLCDSTKFGKTFMCTDFTFDEIDYLVTEKEPPEEFMEILKKTNCKLLIPSKSEL